MIFNANKGDVVLCKNRGNPIIRLDDKETYIKSIVYKKNHYYVIEKKFNNGVFLYGIGLVNDNKFIKDFCTKKNLLIEMVLIEFGIREYNSDLREMKSRKFRRLQYLNRKHERERRYLYFM